MKNLQAIIFAILFVFSINANAGLQLPSPVEVTVNPDGSGEARGSMSAARFSANDVEYTGCRLRGAFGSVQVHCAAQDANEVLASCFSFDPTHVEAVQAITTYSWLFFSFDSDGVCQSVFVSTRSFHIPDLREHSGDEDDEDDDD